MTLRTCTKNPSRWWPFHKWNKGTLYGNRMTADGEGGFYAGEVVVTCKLCGKSESAGVWAKSDDPRTESGYSDYAYMGPAHNSVIEGGSHAE